MLILHSSLSSTLPLGNHLSYTYANVLSSTHSLVSLVSMQLEELSSRLGGLEVDLDTSQSQTVRLKKENMSLKEMSVVIIVCLL